MEAGAEKARYVGGQALAVNNRNEVEVVALDDIYDKAKRLGENVTHAVY